MASIKKKNPRIKSYDKKCLFLRILVIALIILSTVLSAYIYHIKQTTNSSATNASKVSWGSYVNLNLLQFNIVDGEGTVRTDAAFNEIKSFINNESENSRCSVSGSDGRGYVYIQAWSSDEKQLLLRYGCTSASAQMYAVKTNQGWKTISPTNQFDSFGIPGCDYLTDNNISSEIAPVCANGFDSSTGQTSGNPRYLNR